ncbi:MAG: P27 family phage terminase small subunit [Pirellulales bacterium]
MKPKPPRTRDLSHLRPKTREWVESICRDYDLEPHHQRLLRLCAETWDRSQQAREALAANGLTFDDRFGAPHPRPEVAIERDSRIAFARLLRELALDVDAPADESRPPGIAGNASLRKGT